MQALDHEEFWIMLLDTRSRFKHIVVLYKGNISSCSIRSAEVFKEAILTNTPAIVLVHNHPSGDPMPSPDDIAVTRVIVQAGKLLDIQVVDHIILGLNRFASLREKGFIDRND